MQCDFAVSMLYGSMTMLCHMDMIVYVRAYVRYYG